MEEQSNNIHSQIKQNVLLLNEQLDILCCKLDRAGDVHSKFNDLSSRSFAMFNANVTALQTNLTKNSK